ncbi:endolytic transglycosylase MltG [candidate division KSB1 bacterium]|nr:endolytic transglycosylase MltG [candidate division KSB1 bacterium]
MERFSDYYNHLLKFLKLVQISRINRIWLFSAVGLSSALIIIITISYRLFFSSWMIDENTGNSMVHIRSGMSLVQIADSLYQHRILEDTDCFITAAKMSGMSRKLKAGTYQFTGRQTNYRILRRIVKGDILLIKVTLREGIWARDIASILNEKIGINPNEFIQTVNDPALCLEYGIKAESLEGYLYPDTYYLHQGMSAKDAIGIIVNHFFDIFSDSLIQKSAQLDMTMNEVVTMASIIEGEAVLASERPLISALYHKRLRLGMRLQADPTIQYLIPDGPRRLLSKDLEIESPYNSYIHGGLPPGPVNNPGIACIKAALYPAAVPYLYMVANGDGSHTFSTNMEDHLRAKSRFDRVRRSVRRKNGQ